MTTMSVSAFQDFKALERRVARAERRAACGIDEPQWLADARSYFDLAQDAFLACPSEGNGRDMALVSAAFQRAAVAAPLSDAIYSQEWSLDGELDEALLAAV